MLGFSKQEQRLLLFLSVSFLMGLVAKQVKDNKETKPNQAWQRRYATLYKSFKESAKTENKPNISRESSAEKKKDLKQALVGKININTADSEQLQILPRIGPVLAQRIIHYRQAHGLFTSINEIKRVKGIGDKTFESIKSQLTID